MGQSYIHTPTLFRSRTGDCPNSSLQPALLLHGGPVRRGTTTYAFLQSRKTSWLSKSLGLPPSLITRYKRHPEEAPSDIFRKLRYHVTYSSARRAGASSAEATQVRTYTSTRLDRYLQMRRKGYEHSEAVPASKDPNFDNYIALRDAGATPAHAVWNSDLPAPEVAKLIDKHLYYARMIAKENGVQLSHVLRGMRLSDKRPDDWEAYVQLRSRQGWVPVEWSIADKTYVPLSKKTRKYKSWIQYKKGERRFVWQSRKK